MAYISYNKLRENEVDKIDSKRGKLQDFNIIQLKFELFDFFKKKDQKKNKNLQTYR